MPEHKYPYQDGDVTVLGPEVFASSTGRLISWKGQNYYIPSFLPTSAIQKVQSESEVWRNKNFPDHTQEDSLIGTGEELGELLHHFLKAKQAIRTYSLDTEQLAENEQDAIGDLVIYLMGFCSARGYDFEECVVKTWDLVKHRDWVKNQKDGSALSPYDGETL